jgi:hypothetical protein
LQVEHIVARANGGTNRVSNLCLACERCNIAKGTQDIHDFLKNQPEVLENILTTSKAPLKDVAAVNSTRWALYNQLKALELLVECGSGGLTKFNRIVRGLPKAHWCDAANVGVSTPDILYVKGVVPLLITATGHGSRQMCLVDKRGFPRSGPKQAKCVKGFQTGDIVKAVIPSGMRAGIYIGRVAVRATGSFNITTRQGVVQGIHYRYCTSLHTCDGYRYGQGKRTQAPK